MSEEHLPPHLALHVYTSPPVSLTHPPLLYCYETSKKRHPDVKRIKKMLIKGGKLSSPVLKKRMFLLKREKKKIQLTPDSGFCKYFFFVIYSPIQAAKVLIAVCHFYI
ncbi:hypothetical protein XENOCAPTIV_028794 [Xenoophorus captivus]|uniref:Uncharacterized protein n=1 Tax=Xenoophorus captivus TaxID=1517983 RepID=A0ABV0QX28_9TELE